MEAKELMIDDWVLYYDEDYGNQNIKIGLNDIIDMCCLPDGKDDSVHPIPITPEILKVNGFILDGKINEYDKDSYYKGYVDKYNKVYEVHFTPESECVVLFWKNRIYGIKYVHELQHALRLCGLSELADNFKL